MEFALIAPIFLVLLFATLEIAIIFFAGQVLQSITTNTARTIYTGQAQTAGYTQAQFKSYVCSQIPAAFFNCNNLFVNVTSFSSFNSMTISSPINSGSFVNNMQYSPGSPGDVVVVQLFYEWPQFVTGLGFNITNLSGSMYLLQATAAFRNEPAG